MRTMKVLDGQRQPRQTFSMAYSLQIVLDCLHPHDQADWWAQTMGWQVEATDADFILSMVKKGLATEDQTTLHKGSLVWKIGAAITAGDGAGAGQPRILFQLADTAKAGKNRVHWDVRLRGENKSEVREKLIARGATFLWEASQGPFSWLTMADPEGNEFCIN